jgi:hypothetical protein
LIGISWRFGKKGMTPIEKLKQQIYMLKLENKRLREDLKELNKGWVHPNSCLHNEDPWKKWG